MRRCSSVTLPRFAWRFATPPNGPGAQLRPTAPPRPPEHPGLTPEGYQTTIGTRCWTAAAAPSMRRPAPSSLDVMLLRFFQSPWRLLSVPPSDEPPGFHSHSR
jgi:hypothetical protein